MGCPVGRGGSRWNTLVPVVGDRWPVVASVAHGRARTARLPAAGAARRLPTEIDGLLRVVQVHDLRSVAAGAPGDRRAAACALLEQPLVADVASAPAMLDGSLT